MKLIISCGYCAPGTTDMHFEGREASVLLYLFKQRGLSLPTRNGITNIEIVKHKSDLPCLKENVFVDGDLLNNIQEVVREKYPLLYNWMDVHSLHIIFEVIEDQTEGLK